MAKNQGSVRMGPISLFALVVILCMATLCVLCVATAQASSQMSGRYAQSTTAIYETEKAAQAWLAALNNDKTLAQADDAAAQASDMVTAVSEAINVRTAFESLGFEQDVNPRGYLMAVKASFTNSSGKLLDVIVGELPEGNYQVISWKASAVLNEQMPSETLWSGQ